jgi:hypothetical protein
MKILAFVFTLALVTLACGSAQGLNTPDAAAIFTAAAETMIAQMPGPAAAPSLEAPAAAPSPSPDEQPQGKTRDNPASGSQGVNIGGDMVLRVVSVARPADNEVMAGNMFNSTPTPALEYAIVQLQLVCAKSQNDKCSFSTFEVKAVGSDGQIHDPEFVSGVAGLMDEFSYEFFGGSSIAGGLVFLVPKGDPNVVLFHEAMFLGSPIYFTLQ